MQWLLPIRDQVSLSVLPHLRCAQKPTAQGAEVRQERRTTKASQGCLAVYRHVRAERAEKGEEERKGSRRSSWGQMQKGNCAEKQRGEWGGQGRRDRGPFGGAG